MEHDYTPEQHDDDSQDNPPQEIPRAQILCPRCNSVIKSDGRFCTQCGKRIDSVLSRTRIQRARRVRDYGYGSSVLPGRRFDSEWRDTRNVIIFYITMLATALIVGVTSDSIIRTLIIHDLATFVIVMLGFVIAREVMIDPLKKTGFPVWAYGLIILGALATFLYAYGFSWAIIRIFSLNDAGGSMLITPFKKAGYSIFLPALTIAVSAGILEELAFRGIIQGYLHKHLKPVNAILVTGIAFGIMHIQFLNFPLFVMGIYFSWLRWKSGSIYPSIVAHFFHNLTVVIVEWYEII